MPDDKPIDTEHLEQMAALFKAMGDPSRLRLLNELSEKEGCVGELAETTGLSHANTSKHLSVLRAVGLVCYTRKGNSKCFALTSRMISEICLCIGKRRSNNEEL
ncbi:MAG: metalloregulator ArsR/SmtB family transcription factor [Myxococcota bacterium]|nr:metalloregulator ArsR/SmtB family transcription factor [Myxococcota bacterium]